MLDTLESEDSRMAAYYDRIIQEATTQKNKLTAQIQAAKQNNLTILGEVQKVMDTERERIMSLLVKVNDKKPYSLIREFKNIEKTVSEMKSIPQISFEVAAFSAPSIHVGGEVIMKRMKLSVDTHGKAKRVLSTPPDASRSSLTSASSIFVSSHQLWSLPRLWQEYTMLEFLDEKTRDLKNPVYLSQHLSGLLIYDSDSVVRVAYPTGNEEGKTFLHTKMFKGNVGRVVGMWSAGTPVRDFIAQDRLLSYRLQTGDNQQWYTIRNIWEGVLDCTFINGNIYLCKVSVVEIWKLSFNSEDDTKVILECTKKLRHDTNAVAVAGSAVTEEIYVCDKSNSCVHVWTLEGELVRRIPIPGVPISITVAPDGVLLVGTAEGRISVMYPTGELILIMVGEELGGFHSITSIVVKEFDGSIYLCDPYRHRVIVGVLSPFIKGSPD